MISTKLPLSVCMIVKNEEQHLERCLKSITKVIDDIVIVDTGSMDRTIEIAQKYCARVFAFTWVDDFAEARNFSISKAKHKVVLCLDADEELIINDFDNLKEALIELRTSMGCGFVVPIWSYTGEHMHSTVERSSSLRFFTSDCHYIGKIHEQPILASASQPNLLDESTVLIKHYGYLSNQTNLHAKITRNIQILESELAADSTNPFLLYYLGKEHLRSDSFYLALKYFKQALASMNPEIVSFYSSLLNSTIITLTKLNLNKEALALVEQGLKHLPAYTDLYYLRGQIYHLEQNYPLAISSFKVCVDLGDPPCYLMSTQGVGSYKALYSLGMVYQDINEKKLATECFLQAIKINPEFYYPLYNLVAMNIEKSTSNLTTFIETYFDTENECTLHQVVDVLKSFNKYTLAAKYLNRLHLKNPTMHSLNYKLGLCYFYLRKPLKACTLLEVIPKDSTYYTYALKYRFLCRLKLKHFKIAGKDLNTLSKSESNYYPLLNYLYVLYVNKNALSVDCPNTSNNLDIGLSLLEDLLIAKDLPLAKLTMEFLQDNYDGKSLYSKIIPLLLGSKQHELAFSLIIEEFNEENYNMDLLNNLKELIKDRNYLNRFEEFVNHLDTPNTNFKYKMNLLLLRCTAIYLLKVGSQYCPNSDTIKNQLELLEEGFSELGEVK